MIAASSSGVILPCSVIDSMMAARRVFQLAQVAQALFQHAQLRIVQAAGGFLAVARDERHGRALVEQGNGSGDLGGFGRDFGGDTLFDGRQHGSVFCVNRPPCREAEG